MIRYCQACGHVQDSPNSRTIQHAFDCPGGNVPILPISYLVQHLQRLAAESSDLPTKELRSVARTIHGLAALAERA